MNLIDPVEQKAGEQHMSYEQGRNAYLVKKLLAEASRLAFGSLPLPCALAFWDNSCLCCDSIYARSGTERPADHFGLESQKNYNLFNLIAFE